MSLRMIVPELLEQARGARTIDTIVAMSKGAFTKGAYSMWETGKRKPLDKNKAALVDALGVKYEKISLPVEKIPTDSKFFT